MSMSLFVQSKLASKLYAGQRPSDASNRCHRTPLREHGLSFAAKRQCRRKHGESAGHQGLCPVAVLESDVVCRRFWVQGFRISPLELENSPRSADSGSVQLGKMCKLLQN